MGFVKQQLETVKRKRAANVSERNVLYNQQLRRYLKMRKEAKDRPVKVQLSNGAQLLNKTVETGVQVRPGPDEPKDKSVLFAGEDEEIEVPTPISQTPGNSRSPRTNKKAIKQQEINEKKDHLLAIIMSDPQSFGATDRGKILNPKTGREFIDSDLNWSIERLVDPRPENAPSPSGTKELMRKLAQNPLATVKKKHPKLKRTEFDDFLQRNTTYTLFKPKREKFRRLRTVPAGFMTDVQADLADFQALSRKNSGYRYLLLAVDVLSRRMFGSPVKSKRPADVKRAFEEVFDQMPKLPETLYTDRGLEFVAKPMKEFFAENGVKKYETNSKKKAAVAERAIRTLKTRLYKYFSANNTSAWVDVLPKFLSAINNSVCRATGLRPNDISDANAREVWKRVYGERLVPAEKRPKIKAGETAIFPTTLTMCTPLMRLAQPTPSTICYGVFTFMCNDCRNENFKRGDKRFLLNTGSGQEKLEFTQTFCHDCAKLNFDCTDLIMKHQKKDDVPQKNGGRNTYFKMENIKGFRFYFADELGRFTLRIFSDKISHITLTDQLAYVLGYEQQQEIHNEDQAKYAVDLACGVSHLCIYLNSGIIESMIFGNSFANLLQVIAVEGTSGSVVEKDFQSPLFHKIVAREVDVLDVEIRTLTGR
ncbi:hypothetical protein niasHT_002558 [Heterodera trifolii]|uniref:Integrase catalytic domain-containing protein n=1 Tax=Heterodera trifolii TaxID=157864 RepID=A0ABD2LNR6_9BILA